MFNKLYVKKLIGNKADVTFGFVFIFWLVAEVFIRFEPLNNFPNDDSSSFLYIGRSILNGQIPYADTWDHKGPLLYYIDALGLSIFGLWGVWVVQYVLTLAGFFIAFLNGRQLFGTISSLIGILSGFYLLDLFAAGNITEEYSSVFALFAFGLFILYIQNSSRKFTLFGIGFLFMCTFLTRANNIGFQSAIILSIGSVSIIQKDIKILKTQIIWIICGMLALLVPCILYFWENHVLAEFYDQAFLYNMVYIQTSNSSLNFGKFVEPPFRILTIIALATYGAILFETRKIWANIQLTENKLLLLLLLAFPIEFFLSDISGRGYGHYYLTWIPYLIFASGYFINKILNTTRLGKTIEKSFIALILLAYFVIWPPQQTFMQYTKIANHFIYQRANGIEKNHPLVDFIHENSTPQDTVLRWGFGRWLNYAIERESPTRYLYQLELITPGYTTDEMIDEFANDIMIGKPKFIIEAVNYFMPIDSEKLPSYGDVIHPKYFDIVKFIEENYQVVKLKFYAEGQNEEDRWIKVWMLTSSEESGQ